MVPMSVPPGSPRQSAGGGKGGGTTATPSGGLKGGGQAVQGQVPGWAETSMQGNLAQASSMLGPQPNMFGQGNLNTALGSGLQGMMQMYPSGTSMTDAMGVAMPSSGPLQTRAIDSGMQNPASFGRPAGSPMFAPQTLPSGFALNRGSSAAPALPQGLIQRLSGFGGF